MKLYIWVNGFLFVALFFQVNSFAENDPKANLNALQEKVEKLIETVMVAIQEYYNQTEKEHKCLPEKYTAEVMNAVKDGIDCVEKSHREFQEGHIDLQEHRTEFHGCFVKARSTVEYALQNIDPAENNCPPDVVEKTFQINVTTSYTKTFNLNIQNGVDVVYNKTIQVTKNEAPCRNYPDVFSFDEKPAKKSQVVRPSPGVLQSKFDSRPESHHVVASGVTTSRNLGGSAPEIPHANQKPPKDNVAYAYFQEFRGDDNRKGRAERFGTPFH